MDQETEDIITTMAQIVNETFSEGEIDSEDVAVALMIVLNGYSIGLHSDCSTIPGPGLFEFTLGLVTEIMSDVEVVPRRLLIISSYDWLAIYTRLAPKRYHDSDFISLQQQLVEQLLEHPCVVSMIE